MGSGNSVTSGARNKPKQTAPSTTVKVDSTTVSTNIGLVADFGSGHATLFCYEIVSPTKVRQLGRGSLLSDGKSIKLDRFLTNASTLGLKVLAPVLDAMESAVEEMSVKITETGVVWTPRFIIAGATGGVRAALSKKSISQADFDVFATAVVARFPQLNATGMIVSGADEGRWELEAARLIWGQDSERMFNNKLEGGLGLLSGGGSTIQIGANKVAKSYPISTMWDPMDEGKGAPAEAWRDDAIWAAWERDLLASIDLAASSRSGLFSGQFVGTACMEYAARAAGVDGRPVTAVETIQRLRVVADEFRAAHGPRFDELKEVPRRARYNWFRVMALQMVRLAHVLERLFKPDAGIFFTRKGSMACEWTLGAAIEQGTRGAPE